MNTERTLTYLVERNVVEVLDGTEYIRLTDEFRDELEANHDIVEEGNDWLDRTLEQTLENDGQVEQFRDLAAESPDFVARFLTLAEFADDQLLGELTQMTVALDRFFRQPPPEEGIPEAFFAIHGDQLDVVSLYNRAIVYVWRDDCEPCDQMRTTFDALFGEGAEDIALFAVYGPDWVSELRENYNVTAGPTTLFIVNGRVDSRLLGSLHKGAIEAEVEQIRKLSA